MIRYELNYKYGYLTLGRAHEVVGEIVVPAELNGQKVGRMEETFRECCELTGAVLPETLDEIGEALFSDCHGLKTFTIQPHIRALLDRAFCTCRNLESVVVPPSVKEIGREAFYGCEALREIDLPGVETLGAGAFYGDFALEKVTLGEKLTSIPCGAFGYCKSLKEVTVPDSVEKIHPYAFEYSAVETVSVPAKLAGVKLEKCAAKIVVR